MRKLTKISKRQTTLLRKITRKRFRYEYQLFIAEGRRTVKQIIENGQLSIDSIYFDESTSLWKNAHWRKILDSYATYRVPKDEYLEICDTENPQGVFTVCNIPAPVSISELGKKKGLIILMDRIQDPGNLGTMIRTGVWFGVAGMILGKGSVDLFHPKVVRSTAGATGALPFAISSAADALEQLENSGWHISLLDGKPGAEDLTTIIPAEKNVLVVGNEAGGIDEKLFKESRKRVAILGDQKQQNVESLNAAMALGIAIYAFHRKSI